MCKPGSEGSSCFALGLPAGTVWKSYVSFTSVFRKLDLWPLSRGHWDSVVFSSYHIHKVVRAARLSTGPGVFLTDVLVPGASFSLRASFIGAQIQRGAEMLLREVAPCWHDIITRRLCWAELQVWARVKENTESLMSCSGSEEPQVWTHLWTSLALCRDLLRDFCHTNTSDDV